GQADVGGDLIVGGVDGGEGGIDVRGGIDPGDERGIQLDAVAGRGTEAFAVHLLVQLVEILAEVVDGDTFQLGRVALENGVIDLVQGDGVAVLHVEVGDAFPQDGDEVTHDVGHGMLHAEKVGVEVPLR